MLEEGKNGSKQRNSADHIDVIVLQKINRKSLLDSREILRNAGIRYNDVKGFDMVDGSELLHCRCSVRFGSTADFDDDEGTCRCLGKLVQGFAGRVLRVSNGGYHDIVTTT